MLPYLACASPQVDNHLILASPCRDGQFNEMTLNNMRGQTRSCSIFPLCSASSFHLPYCPIPSRCFHSLCPKHGLFFCQGFDTSKLQREGRFYRFCVCFHIRFSWFPQVAGSSSSAHASAVKIFPSWLKACRQFLFVVFLLSRAPLLLFVQYAFHICWSWTSFPSPPLVGLLIINQSPKTLLIRTY